MASRRVEQDKESFDWALRFVDVLQEINVRLVQPHTLTLTAVYGRPADMSARATVQMSPGNIPAFQLLLDILLEFQRPDLVKQCLGTTSRLSLPRICMATT